MAELCEACGVELHVGDWPICHGDPTAHTRSASAVVGDEIPGGMIVENGFEHPIRVYSHSEHRRLLAERGMEIRAKWAGPGDKIMSNWAAGIDAQTLANAAELVTRSKPQIVAPEDRVPITVTDVRYEQP